MTWAGLWWGYKALVILAVLPFAAYGMLVLFMLVGGLCGAHLVAWVKFQMARAWKSMTPEEQARYRAAQLCREMAERLRR